jgi:serine/threonine protein kinase
MAPELLNIKKTGAYCPYLADIWSIGITMYAYAYLNVPFMGKTLE